jgi:hypothetical protein
MFRMLMFVAALLFGASSMACAGAPANSGGVQRPEARGEEVLRYKGAIAELRRHRYSSEALVDIARAEAWLETAKTKVADDHDSPLGRLYLDAVRALLVKVRSHFVARDAERGLQSAKSEILDDLANDDGNKETSE